MYLTFTNKRFSPRHLWYNAFRRQKPLKILYIAWLFIYFKTILTEFLCLFLFSINVVYVQTLMLLLHFWPVPIRTAETILTLVSGSIQWQKSVCFPIKSWPFQKYVDKFIFQSQNLINTWIETRSRAGSMKNRSIKFRLSKKTTKID